MIKFRNILIPMLCLMMMSACSLLSGTGDDGKFRVTMEACEGSTIATGVCKFEVVDATEHSKKNFATDWSAETGMDYNAEGVKAFEGQRIRGDVEKAAVKAFGDAAPSAIDVFLKALGFAPVASPVSAPDPEGPD